MKQKKSNEEVYRAFLFWHYGGILRSPDKGCKHAQSLTLGSAQPELGLRTVLSKPAALVYPTSTASKAKKEKTNGLGCFQCTIR